MLVLTHIRFKDVDDLCTELHDLATEVNLDFSGINGEEYTSKEALEAGFKSDSEMLLNKLREVVWMEDIIDTYLKALFSDENCYGDYRWQSLKTEVGDNLYSIAYIVKE